MMWRFYLLLPAVLGWATFAGCQCRSQPEPLTPEQESELQKRMEQVQQDERAHFADEGPGAGTSHR